MKTKHELSFVEQHQVLQAIMRLPGLDLYQRTILLMIYDRSIAWGWKAEQITLDQFEHGVYSANGECWHPGTGASKKSIVKALAELRELGLVMRQKAGTALKSPYVYLISISTLMAIPKRLKAPSEKQPQVELEGDSGFAAELTLGSKALGLGSKEPSLGSIEPRVRFQGHSKENRIESTNNKKELAERESVLPDLDSITYPKEKLLPLARRIGVAWKSAYAEAFPLASVPELTGMQLTILKSISKTFKSENDFLDYLSWTICHWSFLRTTALGWMTNCPEYPCLRCITGAKVRPPLVEAWLKKAENEKLASLPALEKAIVLTQRAKGLSRASAEAEVMRKDSVTRERKLLAEEREKLRYREESISTRARVIQSALFTPRTTRPSLSEYAKPVDLSDLGAEIPAWEENA